MAKKKESATVVAEATPVVATKSKRNPAYEKAMQEVIKYVNEAENSEDEDLEYYVDHCAKVVVCRREFTYSIPVAKGEPDSFGGTITYGLSKCCPNDRFNVVLGKYLALKRARNRPIAKTVRAVIFGK